MLTQCPHCLTLFRVGPDQLRAADGQVRCSRCNQVFNALKSLEETPTPFTNPSMPEADNAFQATFDPDTAEPDDNASPFFEQHADAPPNPQAPDHTEFKPMLSDQEQEEASHGFSEDILEQDDGLEPAPDYLDIGTESQMSELLEQDSSSLLLPDSEYPTLNTEQEPPPAESAKVVSFIGPTKPEPAVPEPTEEEPTEPELTDEEPASEMPTPIESPDFQDSILKDGAIDEDLGRPDYDSVPALGENEISIMPSTEADDRSLRFEAEQTPRPRERHHRLWLIGSLLLLIPLSGQLLWHFRDSLVNHQAGRHTLNLICSVAGCQVPIRRDLERIAITGRNLSTHPEKPDALQLQLSLVNTAAYEQPFPQLTLSLFNDEGRLIARRTFTTDQYLPQDYIRRPVMPKGQPVLIQIDLVDPGNEVTGFSFDFY
jgi:predicted Zn finger-like uncharacterized protein